MINDSFRKKTGMDIFADIVARVLIGILLYIIALIVIFWASSLGLCVYEVIKNDNWDPMKIHALITIGLIVIIIASLAIGED